MPPVKATPKEREQMLAAVEALLTDPQYSTHWMGHVVWLSEPAVRKHYPNDDEGVWIAVYDRAQKFYGAPYPYVVMVTTDLFGFENRLYTEATEELWERWNAKAERCLKEAERRGKRRARAALKRFARTGA